MHGACTAQSDERSAHPVAFRRADLSGSQSTPVTALSLASLVLGCEMKADAPTPRA